MINLTYGMMLKPLLIPKDYNAEVSIVPYYETDNLKREVNKIGLQKSREGNEQTKSTKRD